MQETTQNVGAFDPANFRAALRHRDHRGVPTVRNESLAGALTRFYRGLLEPDRSRMRSELSAFILEWDPKQYDTLSLATALDVAERIRCTDAVRAIAYQLNTHFADLTNLSIGGQPLLSWAILALATVAANDDAYTALADLFHSKPNAPAECMPAVFVALCHARPTWYFNHVARLLDLQTAHGPTFGIAPALTEFVQSVGEWTVLQFASDIPAGYKGPFAAAIARYTGLTYDVVGDQEANAVLLLMKESGTVQHSLAIIANQFDRMRHG